MIVTWKQHDWLITNETKWMAAEWPKMKKQSFLGGCRILKEKDAKIVEEKLAPLLANENK